MSFSLTHTGPTAPVYAWNFRNSAMAPAIAYYVEVNRPPFVVIHVH